MALSTSSMLLLDQRTLQIKYRIPASEIYRLSLSPFHDNIAVFHVKAVSILELKIHSFADFNYKFFLFFILVGSRTEKRWFCISNCTCHRSDYEIIFGCTKCDWSTAGSMHRFRVRIHFSFHIHANCEVKIHCPLILQFKFAFLFDLVRFEVTFGNQTVILSFHCAATSNNVSSPMKITRKHDRMEIIV